MNLMVQVAGLNKFMTTIYGTETRFGILLAKLGFDAQQIEASDNMLTKSLLLMLPC